MEVLLVNPARYMKDSYIFPLMHLLYIAQAIRRLINGLKNEIVEGKMIPSSNEVRIEIPTRFNYNCIICPRKKIRDNEF